MNNVDNVTVQKYVGVCAKNPVCIPPPADIEAGDLTHSKELRLR